MLGCDGSEFNIARVQNGRENSVNGVDLLKEERRKNTNIITLHLRLKTLMFDRVLKYLFGKADISEALLDCVKLLLVQFAGDNVLHDFAVLTVDIPTHAHYGYQCHVWEGNSGSSIKKQSNCCADLGGVLSGRL